MFYIILDDKFKADLKRAVRFFALKLIHFSDGACIDENYPSAGVMMRRTKEPSSLDPELWIVHTLEHDALGGSDSYIVSLFKYTDPIQTIKLLVSADGDMSQLL